MVLHVSENGTPCECERNSLHILTFCGSIMLLAACSSVNLPIVLACTIACTSICDWACENQPCERK